MKIALIGPSQLTEFDKKEIEENIHDFLSKGNEIAVLAYRSIEAEVFKYFVTNIEHDDTLASKLHIYTVQPFDLLPERIRIPIQFLLDNGATFHSFEISQSLIKRPTYQTIWTEIVDQSDLIVGFNDGEEQNLQKIFIPIDIAKNARKKAVIYQLPTTDEHKFLLEPEEKIRVIE